jgi:hypothetical protein
VVLDGETEIEGPERFPGCQLYDVAFAANNVAFPPAQNEVSFETESGGAAVTVTTTESIAVHPKEFVAVTVYVVVVLGVAVGFAVFAPVSDPDGFQLYEFPLGPDARRIVLPPLQTDTSGLAVTVAVEIFTVTLSVAVHPFASVTVNV